MLGVVTGGTSVGAGGIGDTLGGSVFSTFQSRFEVGVFTGQTLVSSGIVSITSNNRGNSITSDGVFQVVGSSHTSQTFVFGGRESFTVLGGNVVNTSVFGQVSGKAHFTFVGFISVHNTSVNLGNSST